MADQPHALPPRNHGLPVAEPSGAPRGGHGRRAGRQDIGRPELARLHRASRAGSDPGGAADRRNGKRFSKQRLDALFEESPALRGRVASPRSRDSGNTMLSKEFAGGVIILTGANSPTGLCSMPARYLMLDEVDAYPADAEGKGDPDEFAGAGIWQMHLRTGGDLAGLRKLLDSAAFGENLTLPDFETVLDRAAALDPISYDRGRAELAKELGVRAKTLDDQVAKRRAERDKSKKLFLVEPPAWEEPVDAAVLLDAIVAQLNKYLVLPKYAPEAIALWIVHAHALDAFQCSPILAMLSPEKRCAKTTTLTIIRYLLPRPVFASNTSPASVFRLIEKSRVRQPTAHWRRS